VYVCVRARPLRGDRGEKEAWQYGEKTLTPADDPETKPFGFARVFPPSTQTAQVYDEVARPIVER
jgi:hypothetical protein